MNIVRFEGLSDLTFTIFFQVSKLSNFQIFKLTHYQILKLTHNQIFKLAHFQINILAHYQISTLINHIPHIVLQHQHTFLLLRLNVDKFEAGVNHVCFASVD